MQINRLNKYFEKQIEDLKKEQLKVQSEVALENRQEEKRRIDELLREKKRIDDMLEVERKVQSEAEFKRRQKEIEREERLAQEWIEKNAERVEATKAQLGYGVTFDDIVYSLVLHGEHNAVAISHNMVNDFGFDNRMSIGIMSSFYIYMDVLLVLKKLVNNGNLIMDESSDIKDCFFYSPHFT